MEKIVLEQYQNKVNQAVKRLDGFSMRPPEGWLRTARKALGMTGPQLASRLGISKVQIAKTEKREIDEGVTLQTMKKMAEAMNCRFIYAVVPEQEIEQVIRAQAVKKAKERVKAADTQMAFENQALDKERRDAQIERIANEIMDKMPSDLWNDE